MLQIFLTAAAIVGLIFVDEGITTVMEFNSNARTMRGHIKAPTVRTV